jgi:hypothetical protein
VRMRRGWRQLWRRRRRRWRHCATGPAYPPMGSTRRPEPRHWPLPTGRHLCARGPRAVACRGERREGRRGLRYVARTSCELGCRRCGQLHGEVRVLHGSGIPRHGRPAPTQGAPRLVSVDAGDDAGGCSGGAVASSGRTAGTAGPSAAQLATGVRGCRGRRVGG